jgi:sugar lactone lactonase YvrE
LKNVSQIAANHRTLYDFETDGLPGVPDGMTIDANGDLWIASYNGGQVKL